MKNIQIPAENGSINKYKYNKIKNRILNEKMIYLN